MKRRAGGPERILSSNGTKFLDVKRKLAVAKLLKGAGDLYGRCWAFGDSGGEAFVGTGLVIGHRLPGGCCQIPLDLAGFLEACEGEFWAGIVAGEGELVAGGGDDAGQGHFDAAPGVSAAGELLELAAPDVDIGEDVVFRVDKGERVFFVGKGADEFDVGDVLQSFVGAAPARTETIWTQRSEAQDDGWTLLVGFHLVADGFVIEGNVIFDGDMSGQDSVGWQNRGARIEADDGGDGRHTFLVQDEEHVVAWGSEVGADWSIYFEFGEILVVKSQVEEGLGLVVAVRDRADVDPGDATDIIVGAEGDGDFAFVLDAGRGV